jgi:glucose/arabinose dehydrogenase
VKKILQLVVIICLIGYTISAAPQLPQGFTQTLLAQHLDPTDMVVTPDGRIFITIKSGKVVIVENDVLLTNPLLDIQSAVDNFNERGIGHIILDPQFSTNGFFYLYYSVKGENHNRVSRFTAIGNSSAPSSEVTLLNLNTLSSDVHNGGDMVFASDGKLFISSGDGAFSDNAQSFTTLLGKVLRINADGTIPEDNPFYTTTTGENRAIWALGLRNPFSMDIQPGTGKIFVSDVGDWTAEEINEIQAGKNYGWPGIEGFLTTQTPPTNYKNPLYAYPHGAGTDKGCSVVGAAFYNPQHKQFPDEYTGKFFFGDYCNGYISYIDPVSGVVKEFITDIYRPLAIVTGPDGTLYYLARAGIGNGSIGDNTSTTDGTLWKVNYPGDGIPHVSASPQSATATSGKPVSFTVYATGNDPLRYQWLLEETPIDGATEPTYTIDVTQLADNGKKFKCIVINAVGRDTSDFAVLTVTLNTPPTPSMVIALPQGATNYKGGDVISFSATGTDAEDGILPSNAFTWKIDFHHDTHTHPALESAVGSATGEYTVPTVGETSANVWFKIYLTANDKDGLTTTITQEVFPQKVDITLQTVPPGFPITLDGQPVTPHYTFTSVVNITRSLEAPLAAIILNNKMYSFDHWSETTLARSFLFSAPATAKTFEAIFAEVPIGNGTGLRGFYYNKSKTTQGSPDLVRLDPGIDFNWTTGSPDAAINADNFTVRWFGELLPQFSGIYDFYVTADDGVRLWIGDELIIDSWTDEPAGELKGSIVLVAQQQYPIKMEYYENVGSAAIQLQWGSAQLPKQLIPFSQLIPGLTTASEAELETNITVYPTVATERISVANPGGKTYDWVIVNAISQDVKKGSVMKSVSIDIADIPAGVYVLKIGSDMAIRFIKK